MRQISALTITLAILLAGITGTPLSHAAAQSASAKETAAPVSAQELVDINHASIEELKSLPGVREALAEKIVKNRPYANKTQLSSKGVLSAAEYKKIRLLIIAKH